jgi:hypothetical protein
VKTAESVGIRGCDGAVSLLACGIPYLRLHRLAVDVDGAGRELNTNCGFRVHVELITSEPREDLVMLHERLRVR